MSLSKPKLSETELCFDPTHGYNYSAKRAIKPATPKEKDEARLRHLAVHFSDDKRHLLLAEQLCKRASEGTARHERDECKVSVAEGEDSTVFTATIFALKGKYTIYQISCADGTPVLFANEYVSYDPSIHTITGIERRRPDDETSQGDYVHTVTSKEPITLTPFLAVSTDTAFSIREDMAVDETKLPLGMFTSFIKDWGRVNEYLNSKGGVYDFPGCDALTALYAQLKEMTARKRFLEKSRAASLNDYKTKVAELTEDFDRISLKSSHSLKAATISEEIVALNKAIEHEKGKVKNSSETYGLPEKQYMFIFCLDRLLVKVVGQTDV